MALRKPSVNKNPVPFLGPAFARAFFVGNDFLPARVCCCSVPKSCLTLRPYGLHARLSTPLSPGVCSNSRALSLWCHPTVSSSVTPFSSFPYFKAQRPWHHPQSPQGGLLSLRHPAYASLASHPVVLQFIGSFCLPSALRTCPFQFGSQALLFRGNKKVNKLLSQLQSSTGDWTTAPMLTMEFHS